MTIRFTCSECASVLKIKDELAGTAGRCPKCKTMFIVPAPSVHEQPIVARVLEAQTQQSGSIVSSASENPVPVTAEAPNEPGAAVAERGNIHATADSPLADSTELEANGERIAESGSPVKRGITDEPLRLDESDDDVDANAVSPVADDERSAVVDDPPVVSDEDATAGEIEDLDCPPMFVSYVMPPSKSNSDRSESRVSDKPRMSSETISKSPRSDAPSMPESPTKKESRSESPSRKEEAFDPMKFLMADPPAKKLDPFPVTSQDDSDLSLSDDSDDDFLARATPQPMSRPTPAPASTRSTPEKVDLATAARMMKKAIKDSQAEATHQRELDANPGYDYFLFLREFGVRGFGLLFGAIVMVFGLYYVGNFAFGSRLALPKMGYVRGTVKLDGQPLQGAMVQFAPVEDIKIEGTKRDRARTSIGVTDAQGAFTMMYVPGDNIEGVAAGKCRVWVTHMGPKGDDVPPEWTQGAMLTRDVTPGQQKAPIEIHMQSVVAPKAN